MTPTSGQVVEDINFGNRQIDAVPLTVLETVVQDGESQRTSINKIAVRFSEPAILPALIADGSITYAVGLFRVRAGQPPEAIPLRADQFSWDSGSNTLTWMLDAADPGEVLPPGSYAMCLDAASITDLSGNPLAVSDDGAEPLGVAGLGSAQILQAAGRPLQVASYSVPAVADWDSDGLPDLIVGEEVPDGPENVLGKVRVYRNTGTATAWVFDSCTYAQVAGADLVVTGSGCLGAFPRVFDWDGDGRKDLVVGQSDGRVALFLNVNTDADPRFASATYLQVGPPEAKVDIDVGYRATLDIVDWNNDGRYDLVVGGRDGAVTVFLNEAASGAAGFTAGTQLMDGTGALSVPWERASVAVYDLNGDGRKDLLAGNTEGQLVFYANGGSDAAPTFSGYRFLQAGGSEVNLDGSPRSRPFVADVNQDGLPDLLVGAADGLVRLYAGQPAESSGALHWLDASPPRDGFVYAFAVTPQPGITVSPTSGLATTEDFGTARFSLVLNSRPTADVTIGLSVDDPTEGSVSPATIVFTRDNWNLPQTATVRGAVDFAIDGDVGYNVVTAAASSPDGGYVGLDAADVAVVNRDNQTDTVAWSGPSGEGWSLSEHWVNGSLPRPVDRLAFPGSGGSASVNDLSDNPVFASILLGGGDSQLSGAGLTLDPAGGVAIESTDSQHDVGLPLTLGSDATILVSGDSLNLGGQVDTDGHQLTLVNLGAGGLQIDGAIVGTGGVVIGGTGLVTLSGDNHHSGGTTVTGGTLEVTDADALPRGENLAITGGTVRLASGLGQAIEVGGLSITLSSQPPPAVPAAPAPSECNVVQPIVAVAAPAAAIQSQTLVADVGSPLPAFSALPIPVATRKPSTIPTNALPPLRARADSAHRAKVLPSALQRQGRPAAVVKRAHDAALQQSGEWLRRVLGHLAIKGHAAATRDALHKTVDQVFAGLGR